MDIIKNNTKNYKRIIFFSLFVILTFFLINEPTDSFAATVNGTTCTDGGAFANSAGTFSDDIFDMIKEVIKDLNKELIQSMYLLYGGIIALPQYRFVITAAITLMLIFFAVSFMFGIVPATFAQALIRLIKIGILFWMISANGMLVFFGGILVQFFYVGVQCLIIDVTTIGVVNLGFTTGDPSLVTDLLAAQASCHATSLANNIFGSTAGSVVSQLLLYFGGDIITGPLLIFKSVMNMIFSPRMFVISFAAFTTGPYGPIMGLALLWSIWQLLLAIIKGLQVYVLSLIVRAILLGLAPIFVPFILFERTKHLFMGWINQLVSFSLQPVMLFAFLSFFSMLITDAANDMVPTSGAKKVEVCYTKTSSVGELPFDIQKWSFKVNDKMYEGEWTTKGCTLPNGSACKSPFPIEIVNILIFLILTYVAVQMVDVVVGVAAQIAQGSMRLTGVANAANSWFTGQGGSGSSQYARNLARNSQRGK